MSYKDVFGFDPDEGVASPTPLEDMAVTPDATSTDPETPAASTSSPDTSDEPTPLMFSGFSSGRPLLIERPSLYLNRLHGSIGSLLIPPENDQNSGVDGRVLCSPIMSLPYPILYGDERFPDEDAASYPLLRAPANHPFNPDTDMLDTYALTAVLSLYAAGMLYDDGHDLLTYPIQNRYEIPDGIWETATDWVREYAQQLASLNLGRTFGFALRHPEQERDSLTTLFRVWDVTMTGDEIIADATEAANRLAPDWPFDNFEPFKE